jgi:hypothetical protein
MCRGWLRYDKLYWSFDPRPNMDKKRLYNQNPRANKGRRESSIQYDVGERVISIKLIKSNRRQQPFLSFQWKSPYQNLVRDQGQCPSLGVLEVEGEPQSSSWDSV